MELIIIILSILTIIVLGFIMKINVKDLKKKSLDQELSQITNRCSNNKKICEEILEKLNNPTVTIEENLETDSTLYIAVTNKIQLGNMHDSYLRIQTIAHECLHSVQDRKLLMFNFIYSNIYLIYFVIITILAIIKKIENPLLFSNILLILSLIFFLIRGFLENDAMIKAEFIATEYVEEQKELTKEEKEKIEKGFKEINKVAIPGTNYMLLCNIIIKVIIFNVVALIF